MKWRIAFAKQLRKELFLSVNDSEIISRRRTSDILRILKNLDSVIDSFLLFDRTMFGRTHEDHKALIRALRVTLSVSAYSIDDQISKWKDFVNHFTTVASQAIVGEQVSLKGNCYAFLLKVGKFSKIISGTDLSQKDYMSLAHVISTRHLANGGRSAIAKAIKQFKVTTGSYYHVSGEALQKLDRATRRVAGIAFSLSGQKHVSGGHVSLNTSGTLDVPVSAGGRAADAMLDLKEFLNGVPKEPEVYHLPWGDHYCPADLERWASWGRLEERGPWLSRSIFERVDRGARLRGCNEYTGEMIFTVAFIKYEEHCKDGKPIPIRQATVSEPGGKARIVTTGPWWLAVIQQPLCHGLRELLGFHPSAHSCLLRCDQAWQSLHVLSNAKDSELAQDEYVLSSDLKEATDAIPHDVGRTMLRALLEQIGATEWLWIVDLIGPRTVFAEDGDVFLLKRGVMMGEPLSKILLVLLGLTMEEIAFSEYTGKKLSRKFTIDTKWRSFHLGGDDHLARGPLAYLKGITANHRLYGSIISPTKHRLSKIFVVYTEKLLVFRGRVANMPVNIVNDNIEKSVFIDSIKIRLLSPFTKATDTMNDKNVAIGKCIGLASTFKWFSDKPLMRLVFDRAQYRFRDFIASGHHKTLSSVQALPVSLGGLGFSIDTKYLENLPECFNKALRAVALGGSEGYQAQVTLSQTYVNKCPRGVSPDDVIANTVKQFLDYPKMVNLMSFEEALDQVDPERNNSFSHNLWLLRKKDIVSLRDIPSIAERAYVMRKLLEQSGVGKPYRTETNSRRIAKTWNDLNNLGLTTSGSQLTIEELKLAEKVSKRSLYIDLSQTTTIVTVDSMDPEYDNDNPWATGTFLDVSQKQSLTWGEPTMSVRLKKGVSLSGP